MKVAPTERPRVQPLLEIVVRPEWRVGDRWSFKRTALTGATSVVTHQVIAAMLDGYTVRIDGLERVLHHTWRMARPGRVRVAFGAPLTLEGDDYETLARRVEDAVRAL